MQADKPYYIRMQDRGEYLYVLTGGDKLTAEISAAYWREIAAACEALGRTKILIEKDFKETVSPAEMIEMSAFLGALLPNYKIAFIDRYGNEGINELGKKLARSRDVKMQVFSNVENGEEWLRVN
jgi:hypothetical protein